MKTWLLPIDFSETSKNAARYAVALANETPDVKLVLYHVFGKIAAGSDGTPLDLSNTTRKDIAEIAMNNLISELAHSSPIEVVAEEGESLTENLARYVRHNGADLVVMGLTGASRIEQLLMGTNALNMAHAAVCPVLIVPPQASYSPVKNILFATDMKNVKQTTPVKALRSVLSVFNAKLHVVNVDADHYVELTEEYKQERAHMDALLDGFNPDYFFVRFNDFLDAVQTFVEDKKIDIIITVPRKHSFLSSLFKPSHTRKLLYHTHVPLIAVHE
jgi:nucleotide-binding universal stress UspA family protein